VADPTGRSSFTLASFNVYMGVDGWGRPYDVIGACAGLDADVIVVQESWAPADGGPSTAQRIADALGYRMVVEEPLAPGRVFGAPQGADSRWGPRLGQRGDALLLDGQRPNSHAEETRPSARGQWGVAMVARIPVHGASTTSLGRLTRDPARRAVVGGITRLDGREVFLFGTHMSHITYFSYLQYRRLAAVLPPNGTPTVLAGDMNLWGPPVVTFLPGRRRAVRGPTWPAHRPHSQLDHILVTPGVRVIEARVAPFSGSDHRPVVARLALTGSGEAGSGQAVSDDRG
jgi:endonuclease/exonuclease/phosphatase family metal-dependent hydrolase